MLVEAEAAAGRAAGAALVVLGVGLVGLLRAHHLAVGVVLLRLGGHLAHVDVGADLHARLAGADDALDQVLDPRADARPRSPACSSSASLPPAPSLAADSVLPCWSITMTRSGFRFGTAPATRFCTARTWSVEGSRAPTPMVTEAEACSALVLEQLPLGQHQVDAGEGDAVQRADGARQLALGGALHVELLDEVGLAQRVLRSRRSRSRPSRRSAGPCRPASAAPRRPCRAPP